MRKSQSKACKAWRIAQKEKGLCRDCARSAATWQLVQDGKIVAINKLGYCADHVEKRHNKKVLEYKTMGLRGKCIICHGAAGKICKSCAGA